MSHGRLPTLILMALVIGAGAAYSTAVAQEPDSVIRLTVFPADAPDPALKYQLLPPLLERRPGNAAVWYGKVTAEQTPFFNSQEIWGAISGWTALPLDEVRSNQQLQTATSDNEIFRNLERAARSQYCDWQLPIRDEPFFRILLPELQQTRSFARLLAVRVRRQVADEDFEGALRTLQSGYALARNAAKGPTLINAFVGLAESELMSRQLQTFVQQPKAPNLYWALTSLPDPLVDPRPGIEAELAAWELNFPALQELTGTDYGDRYWQQQLQRVWYALREYTGSPPHQSWELLALTVRAYPLAKKGLMDDGWSKQRVDAMPVAQVVLVYSVMQYQRRRDAQMKWLFVPYPATYSPEAHDGEARKVATPPEVFPLADALIPSVRGVRYAVARSQRSIAILRLIEAIRLYGARHDGRLPPSLDAISDVPLPLDPINGKPFAYRVQQGMAVIEGPTVAPGGLPPLRLELRFATPSP